MQFIKFLREVFSTPPAPGQITLFLCVLPFGAAAIAGVLWCLHLLSVQAAAGYDITPALALLAVIFCLLLALANPPRKDQ